MEVFVPSPKARSASAMSWLRIRRAISMVPTLDDSRRLSDVVQRIGGFHSSSLYGFTCGSMRVVHGTLNTVSGLTKPCSIAHDSVTSLLVDPGSKRSVSGELRSVGAATRA